MDNNIHKSQISNEQKQFLQSMIGKKIDTNVIGKNKDIAQHELQKHWEKFGYSKGGGFKIVNGNIEVNLEDQICTIHAFEILISLKGDYEEGYFYFKIGVKVSEQVYDDLAGQYTGQSALKISTISENEYYDTEGFVVQPSDNSELTKIAVFSNNNTPEYDNALVIENKGGKYVFISHLGYGANTNGGLYAFLYTPNFGMPDEFSLSWQTEL